MTNAMTLDPTALAAPPTPPVSSSDRTPDAPSPSTPEEAAQQVGLTKEDEKNLIKVMNHFAQKWSFNHRSNIKRCSRVFEYIRDHQYNYWDATQGRWVDPFEEAQEGSQGGNDDLWGYKYVNNVIQFLERVISNSLMPGIPKVKFQPADAESDEDVQAAEEASRAQAFVSRQNNARRFLRQRLLYLFAAGNYFRYTRYVRDSDRAGISKEPVWTMEEQTIAPDRFVCPQCATETPANQLLSQAEPQCPACGAKLSQADYYPAQTLPLPKIVGMDEVPNGQVAWSLYNTLHVMVAPDCNDPTVDPLSATPILKLDDEVDLASLRGSYPKAWDLLRQNSNSTGQTGQADGEFSRMARVRNFTATQGRNGSNMENRPTLTRCWIREFAFNCLDTKADADRLRKLFPNGCKLVCVGEQFLEAIPEKLTDHWTSCAARPGFGPYPPAIADPAMPFQDRINDMANNQHNYMDRLAVPDVWANVDLIDVEAMNGQSMSGGGLKPWKSKKGAGQQIQTIKDALFQPSFHADPQMATYQDQLWLAVQIIVGANPQMWGGGQQHIDTASGQRQALGQASTVLKDYWEASNEEEANAAKISVKCLGENELDDPSNAGEVENDSDPGKKFSNQRIHIDALKGNFNCYPDTEAGMPSTEQDIRERLTEMITAAGKNPAIMEAFKPFKNRRMAMKILGPDGFETDGQGTWDAVMQDIGQLLQGEPAPGPDPMNPGQTMLMPSGPLGFVVPDKALYDLSVAFQACQEWGLHNRDKVRAENPAGWSNFLLYLKIVAQMQADQAMPAATPGGPAAPMELTGGNA